MREKGRKAHGKGRVDDEGIFAVWKRTSKSCPHGKLPRAHGKDPLLGKDAEALSTRASAWPARIHTRTRIQLALAALLHPAPPPPPTCPAPRRAAAADSPCPPSRRRRRLALPPVALKYTPPLLRAPPQLTPAPRLALRLPAVAARASGGREVRAAEGDGRRVIPIARCYDAGLARLEVTGAARWEQAVAAAAAADGGVAADAHLGAGSEAMVMEAFLPGPGGAASTRVILQAKEVQEKASKIKKDYGDDFFSENEPHSESILAMALKQVVMEKLANFRLEVFSPG
ncbi:uncharacterized protein [Lolium perenne]|uniref:uncharacterized protein n=1 Tax=Lolium perenne TaxID=4522 RepID=UPI003A99FEE1